MGLFSKLRGIIRKTPKASAKPPRQRIAGGHRGHALGSIANPDLSQENINKWHEFTEDESSSFVYDQELVLFHSTNVAAGQYFIDDKKMMLEYKDGSAYLYSGVTEQDAINFIHAQSKGRAVWDILGHPNSNGGVKKPYTRIR